MNEICYKTTFFELLRDAAKIVPHFCNPSFIPTTWSLPKEKEDFQNSIRFGGQKGPWILKPANGQCGHGIELVLNDDENQLKDGHIIQEYIQPLVFEEDEGPWGPRPDPKAFPRHKWDWRVYIMLIHEINSESFAVYFSHFGLLRFCSEPYKQPSDDRSDFSHITNLSINARNPNLVASPVKKWKDSFPAISRKVNKVKNNLSSRSSSEYDKNDPIVNRIKEISLFMALAIRGAIETNLREKGLFGRPYFHVVGIDFMFDEHGNPYLLELNDRPSMIRRPEDDHEIEKTAMIREELEIIFHHKRQDELGTWEKLYPQIPSYMSSKLDDYRKLENFCTISNLGSGSRLA
jgi:hypothetical protein